MAKPVDLPRFAEEDLEAGGTPDQPIISPDSGEANVVAPIDALKLSGWPEDSYPTRQSWNWFTRKTYQWLWWFKRLFAQDLDARDCGATQNGATLQAAITTIGSTVTTLWLYGSWDTSGSTLVFPATLKLKFAPGAILTGSGTVTINSFDGSGVDWKVFNVGTVDSLGNGFVPSVFFGSGYRGVANAKWWGATQSSDPSTKTNNISAALNSAIQSGAKTIVIDPGVYTVDTRYMRYTDGVYYQATRCGCAVPSNRTILGYGVKLIGCTENADIYSFFSSFKTDNVHIRGFWLYGDADTNTLADPTKQYGLGIDFRDVTNSSAVDIKSDKMLGDSFYLGTTDTASTGSKNVFFGNISGTGSRRQGLSITAGEIINVDNYQFSDISGVSGGPCVGIDIEPNTSAFVRDVNLSNGIVENCNCPINAYKVRGLTINGLCSTNNGALFPRLIDRVEDAMLSNITCIGGVGSLYTSNYGILWQLSNSLKRIFVSNFSIRGVRLFAVYLEENTGYDWENISLNNGNIEFYDGAINTSLINTSVAGVVSMKNIKFVVPSGFTAPDAANLDGGRILSFNSKWRDCVFDNRGSVTFATESALFNTDIFEDVLVDKITSTGLANFDDLLVTKSPVFAPGIADANTLIGDGSSLTNIGIGTESSTLLSRNCVWSIANNRYERILANNYACAISLSKTGQIFLLTNSDAGNTVGSPITFRQVLYVSNAGVTRIGDIATNYTEVGSDGAISTVGTQTDGLTYLNSKCALTVDGGYAIKLTNRTGGVSVAGECVTASSSYNGAVEKLPVDSNAFIGVFFSSGVADGAEAWIVTKGLANVYYWDSVTRGQIARTGITGDSSEASGQAIAENATLTSDMNRFRIGVVSASRTGAGLAYTVLD